ERFRRRITVHATPFVPKPHTPFEREAMAEARVLEARMKLLTKSLRPAGIAVRAEGTAWARVQGVLARGDRALGQALNNLPAPTLAGWRTMVRQAGVDERAYLGARSPDETLPWNVVQ
ncbi:MAG TPA: B12-binding domain-containing radical SAM protein, partial [Anaerolineae bacterium]|nr:B12-binding domain-containing radical SAM protein [Anaerolineae bacterium]